MRDIDPSPELEVLANRIAGELLAELNAGKLEKVGIEEIRSACTRDRVNQQALVEMTTRRLIEAARISKPPLLWCLSGP
jgi:hypothetical protein